MDEKCKCGKVFEEKSEKAFCSKNHPCCLECLRKGGDLALKYNGDSILCVAEDDCDGSYPQETVEEFLPASICKKIFNYSQPQVVSTSTKSTNSTPSPTNSVAESSTDQSKRKKKQKNKNNSSSSASTSSSSLSSSSPSSFSSFIPPATPELKQRINEQHMRLVKLLQLTQFLVSSGGGMASLLKGGGVTLALSLLPEREPCDDPSLITNDPKDKSSMVNGRDAAVRVIYQVIRDIYLCSRNPVELQQLWTYSQEELSRINAINILNARLVVYKPRKVRLLIAVALAHAHIQTSLPHHIAVVILPVLCAETAYGTARFCVPPGMSLVQYRASEGNGRGGRWGGQGEERADGKVKGKEGSEEEEDMDLGGADTDSDEELGGSGNDSGSGSQDGDGRNVEWEYDPEEEKRSRAGRRALRIAVEALSVLGNVEGSRMYLHRMSVVQRLLPLTANACRDRTGRRISFSTAESAAAGTNNLLCYNTDKRDENVYVHPFLFDALIPIMEAYASQKGTAAVGGGIGTGEGGVGGGGAGVKTVEATVGRGEKETGKGKGKGKGKGNKVKGEAEHRESNSTSDCVGKDRRDADVPPPPLLFPPVDVPAPSVVKGLCMGLSNHLLQNRAGIELFFSRGCVGTLLRVIKRAFDSSPLSPLYSTPTPFSSSSSFPFFSASSFPSSSPPSRAQVQQAAADKTVRSVVRDYTGSLTHIEETRGGAAVFLEILRFSVRCFKYAMEYSLPVARPPCPLSAADSLSQANAIPALLFLVQRYMCERASTTNEDKLMLMVVETLRFVAESGWIAADMDMGGGGGGGKRGQGGGGGKRGQGGGGGGGGKLRGTVTPNKYRSYFTQAMGEWTVENVLLRLFNHLHGMGYGVRRGKGQGKRKGEEIKGEGELCGCVSSSFHPSLTFDQSSIKHEIAAIILFLLKGIRPLSPYLCPTSSSSTPSSSSSSTTTTTSTTTNTTNSSSSSSSSPSPSSSSSSSSFSSTSPLTTYHHPFSYGPVLLFLSDHLFAYAGTQPARPLMFWTWPLATSTGCFETPYPREQLMGGMSCGSMDQWACLKWAFMEITDGCAVVQEYAAAMYGEASGLEQRMRGEGEGGGGGNKKEEEEVKKGGVKKGLIEKSEKKKDNASLFLFRGDGHCRSTGIVELMK